MLDFIPGQRWICDTELQMGLGTVLAVDQRSVTIVFLSTGDRRIYAKETAPLTRIVFAPGDIIRSHMGWSLTVESVKETNGLLCYFGTKKDGSQAEFDESHLDNYIQLSRPGDRLFSHQIDADKWFELRYQTLLHIHRLAHSDLRGLIGVRTELIPHQLYIAHEVANRYAPRVLLADEVGLGKTIEAGLILHHQLLTERAKRVLIVVPQSLLHQWLVEMMRRFNLFFSLFDEARCTALGEDDATSNPFHSEQLVLCDLEFLVKHPQRHQQALEGSWDLLVVDEAHHLLWTPTQSSVEYDVIAGLADRTKGVLLLTATPEQLGKSSHFARLRLLDAERFPDYKTFKEEEDAYKPIAQAVEELLNKPTLSKETYHTLQATLGEGDNASWLQLIQASDVPASEQDRARNKLIEHLLDRHGTGRVLFRNTRSAVKGFPLRKMVPYPLQRPDAYAHCLTTAQLSGSSQPHLLLCPELLYQAQTTPNMDPWTQIDPRVFQLHEILVDLKPQKVLVITASAQTALDLEEVLRTSWGIFTAVFHEGLSILERDRAAAYFADPEQGCQIMVCSEIGSEGRNFQFAHHLILFDLPLNPDLLEQRIGRLDRIGQTETIHIHVPYICHTAQMLLFRWYHDGLSAFEHTCPAGHSIYVQLKETLLEAIYQIDEGIKGLDALIDTTKTLHQELNNTLRQGRDRLLEYNSCRPLIANGLKERALALDQKTDLQDYLESVFDCYGIDIEDDVNHRYIIRPSEYMQTETFPGLKPEGATITYNRQVALANEEVQYLTWEHPLVTGAMDMVTSRELGNTSLTAIKYPSIKRGSLLLECIYLLESATNTALQSERYLPPTILRIVMDQNGANHEATLSHDIISKSRIPVDIQTASQIVRSHLDELKKLLLLSEKLALQTAPGIIADANDRLKNTFQAEIDRLTALRQLNPNVRDEEIEYFKEQLQIVHQLLASSQFRMEALRVIVVA